MLSISLDNRCVVPYLCREAVQGSCAGNDAGANGMNIKRVAKIAEVSVATVSRVLNHPERVSPETRERVLTVIREKNYTPNWFARGLNHAKTNTIAILVPAFVNDIYQEIIAGIETVAHKKRIAVFLCDTHNDRSAEYEYLSMVVERRVDGVVLVSSLLEGEETELLHSAKVPCVAVGPNWTDGCRAHCSIDQAGGVYHLTRHMLEMGHRRLYLLVSNAHQGEREEIERGFLDACAEVPITGEVHIGEDNVRGGYLVGKKLLQHNRSGVALITRSSHQAFGVMQAAQEVSAPIPEKIAIASMTGSPMSAVVSPPLTHLDQPAVRLGMVSARMLFDMVEHEWTADGTEPPQKMVLHPRLKIGMSCGNTKHIYELFD